MTLAMQIVLYVCIAVIFTVFVAFVFSAMTLLMGKLSTHFEVTGPEDWSFLDFYLRYLVIAAVFTFVSIPLVPLLGCLGSLLGLAALTATYKRVFDADWLQAIVLGGMGGAIAVVLFVFLLVLILQPLGL